MSTVIKGLYWCGCNTGFKQFCHTMEMDGHMQNFCRCIYRMECSDGTADCGPHGTCNELPVGGAPAEFPWYDGVGDASLGGRFMLIILSLYNNYKPLS